MSMNVAEMEKHTEAHSEEMCAPTGSFSWNELLASDVGEATKFYSQLFGWQTADFEGAPGGMKYTLLKKDGHDIGGLMQRPKEQMPPQWLAYVKVDNVDASAKKAGSLGAKVVMPPMDIPNVGRIAVFVDPQGAALGIFQPAKQ
jgi:predicted enzyme related to lactoylglutathione lyase